jgi:hypothetical protein
MLDASWLLFVMWDMCSMCQTWQLRAYAVYRLYIVILYWLMFLELFNFITCLLCNPIFCLTSPSSFVGTKYSTILLSCTPEPQYYIVHLGLRHPDVFVLQHYVRLTEFLLLMYDEC